MNEYRLQWSKVNCNDSFARVGIGLYYLPEPTFVCDMDGPAGDMNTCRNRDCYGLSSKYPGSCAVVDAACQSSSLSLTLTGCRCGCQIIVSPQQQASSTCNAYDGVLSTAPVHLPGRDWVDLETISMSLSGHKACPNSNVCEVNEVGQPSKPSRHRYQSAYKRSLITRVGQLVHTSTVHRSNASLLRRGESPLGSHILVSSR